MRPQLRRALTVAACAAIASSLLHAQGRGGAEWTTSGYDAQRTASIKADPRISVQSIQKPGEFGAFKFLWKLKLEYDPKAATALTQPILLDRIIGFRGFKSIAFVGTQSETVHAIDIDVGAPLWKYHINYSASPPPVLNVTTDCPGGLVASMSRPTTVASAAGGGVLQGPRGPRRGWGGRQRGRPLAPDAADAPTPDRRRQRAADRLEAEDQPAHGARVREIALPPLRRVQPRRIARALRAWLGRRPGRRPCRDIRPVESLITSLQHRPPLRESPAPPLRRVHPRGTPGALGRTLKDAGRGMGSIS